MYRNIFLALTCAVVACGPAREPAAPIEMTASGAASHSMTGMGDMSQIQYASLSPEIQRQVDRLRVITAPFVKLDAARTAGWDARITNCFSDPQLGGMGFHYGNTGFINDGKANVDQPELLLYEPQADGRLRFVAVEYVVPFSLWTQPQPPRLYGQFFHRNEAFGLWILHVWHVANNPRGIFSDWNPTVSCQFARQ